MKPSTRLKSPDEGRGLEYVVVVVIIIVLMSIALPKYGGYIRSSQVTEATTRISEILTAAKIYAEANLDDIGEPVWPPVTGGGFVDLSNTAHFRYAITAGAGENARLNGITIAASGLEGGEMMGVTVAMQVQNIMAGSGTPMVTKR